MAKFVLPSPIASSLCCALLFASLTSLRAQSADSSSQIHGLVVDAATGASLEGAIVFLPGTGLGTATSGDGSFRIQGESVLGRILVIARVGYERCETTLTASMLAARELRVALSPRLIVTRGVDVTARSKDAEGRPLRGLFFPANGNGNYSLFGPMFREPIGVIPSDSVVLLYALTPVVIDNQRYLRLWLLYRNQGPRLRAFDPVPNCAMVLSVPGEATMVLGAEQASAMDGRVDTVVAKQGIEDGPGRSLLLSAEIQRDLERNAVRPHAWVFWDVPNADWESSRSVVNPVRTGAMFEGSVNEGILRPRVVAPGTGVHGYVYFRFPGEGDAGNWAAVAAQYHLQLILRDGGREWLVEIIPG